MEKPEEWTNWETEDPEFFEESFQALSFVINLLGQIQSEMSLAIQQDPKSQEANKKWNQTSEQRMMDFIEDAVKRFVGAMPVASMNGVNLFASAISCHSGLTGDPLIKQIIEKRNNQILNSQD